MKLSDKCKIRAVEKVFWRHSEKPSLILRKILDFAPLPSPDLRDEKMNLYMDCFHIETVDFERKKIELTEKLGQSKLVFLHSYAKNGKSTFINSYIHQAQTNGLIGNQKVDSFGQYLLDFAIESKTKIARDPGFFETKCYLFFEQFIDNYEEDARKALKAILLFPYKKHPGKNNENRDFKRLFRKIGPDILKALEEDSGWEDRLLNLLKEFLKISIPEDASDNLFIADTSLQLFYLLILSVLHTNYKAGQKSFIFFLDNLDDISTDYYTYLSSLVILNSLGFIRQFAEHFSHEVFKNLNPSLLSGGLEDGASIKFVVAYRSANYVSAINILESTTFNPSLIDRAGIDKFEMAPVVKISTIKSSFDIIERRLMIYKELCKLKGVRASDDPDYRRITRLIKSFRTDKEAKESFKYALRLWNGNRNQFMSYLSSFDSSFDLKEVELASLETVKGIFVFYLLKYYFQLGAKDAGVESTLGSIIEYSFNSFPTDHMEERCNLLRMVISLVVNTLNRGAINQDQIISGSRRVTTAEEIKNHGISLLEILSYFDKIKVADPNDSSKRVSAYSESDFQKLFDVLFTTEYDEWSHLFTCYKKSTDQTGVKFLKRKKYDFSSEIQLFFLDKSRPTTRERLDGVRIYYNDNAFFLETNIRRHFEYYALSIMNDGELLPKYPKLRKMNTYSPLPYLFNLTPSSRLVSYTIEPEELRFEAYDFAGESIIDAVFDRAQKCIAVTTSFFKENMSDKEFDLVRYCTIPSAALKGKMFFDDLISRHIGYLESIRHDVIHGKIPLRLKVGGQFEPVLNSDPTLLSIRRYLNYRFIKAINDYLDLFQKHLYEVSEGAGGLPQTLEATRGSFSILRDKIQVIEKSKFLDFKTRIVSYQ